MEDYERDTARQRLQEQTDAADPVFDEAGTIRREGAQMDREPDVERHERFYQGHNASEYERLKADLAAREIEGAPATGSALKDEPYVRAATFVADRAADGRHFTHVGGDGIPKNLTQVEQGVNEHDGIVEWIVDEHGNLTHQRFIKDGRITGFPNQKPHQLP